MRIRARIDALSADIGRNGVQVCHELQVADAAHKIIQLRVIR